MNKIIYRELKKCKNIDTSSISQDDTVLYFKRRVDTPIFEGSCYILELDKTLLNINNNPALAYNWNNGTVPTDTGYKCEILKLMGNMVKINGLSYDLENNIDTNRMWSGWLPKESIKVIKEI